MRSIVTRAVPAAWAGGLLLAILACAAEAPTTPKTAKAPAPAPAVDELTMAPFGAVRVLRPAGPAAAAPRRVVLLISDSGGITSAEEKLATTLAASGALVATVDLREYGRHIAGGKGKCAYAAAHFEALSQGLQKQLALKQYQWPDLIGLGAGGTLAYAVLAESPPSTFRGAVSLGFDARLELPVTLCRQNHLDFSLEAPPGRVLLLAATVLPGAWVALPRTAPEAAVAAEFVRQAPGAVLLAPAPVSDQALLSALVRLDEAAEPAPPPPSAAQLADLPLIELPTGALGRDELAVIYSGDGGWAGLDRDVGGALVAAGIPVVGVSSLQYFWTRRTPDGAAADLERMLRHYLSAWNRRRIILVGYSAGADVLPFLAARLPADLRNRVAAVALLGPSATANFEFHVAEWLGHQDESELPTAPEVSKLSAQGIKVLCFFGEGESDSLCRALPAGLVKLYPEAGSHHFGGHYDVLAQTILKEVGDAKTP